MLLKELLPVTFYIASFDIRKYSITLPTGKHIILMQGNEYVTSDQEEIDFLSKQKGLGIIRPTDSKEKFMRYIGARFDERPTLENMCGQSEEDFGLFMLNSVSEDLVIEHLRRRGYQVELNEKLPELMQKAEEAKNADLEESNTSSNVEQDNSPKEDTVKRTSFSKGKSLRSK